MALARTSKSAARLSRQFRERAVGKVYLALVEGSMPGSSGEIRETLVRTGDLTRPARPGEPGAEAILAWAVRRILGDWTLLEIDLKTGFKHQIRAQLAALGRPVIGDVKYGGRPGEPGPAIGLWAESLSLTHPTRGERMTFTAEPWPLWPWTVLRHG
jgi:23S rRNA pseudouridine1911/1915/1917 synthase